MISYAPIKVQLTTFFLLLVLISIAHLAGVTTLIAPFSATCALLAVLPNAPFSQGKVIFISHCICIGIGVAASYIPAHELIILFIAVWLSIIGMVILKSLHAPAVAHTVILIIAQQPVLTYAAVAFAIVLALSAWSYFKLDSTGNPPSRLLDEKN